MGELWEYNFSVILSKRIRTYAFWVEFLPVGPILIWEMINGFPNSEDESFSRFLSSSVTYWLFHLKILKLANLLAFSKTIDFIAGVLSANSQKHKYNILNFFTLINTILMSVIFIIVSASIWVRLREFSEIENFFEI